MMTQNVLAPSGSPQLIRWTKRTVLWLFLIAIALLSLFPIILVLLGSFKTNQELTGGATIWPKIWQFSTMLRLGKPPIFRVSRLTACLLASVQQLARCW